MDFQLSQSQSEFHRSVRAFAQSKLASGALARAHSASYPWREAKLFSEQGLVGLTLPESMGGQGGSLVDAVLAIGAVASVCPRSADIIQAGNFGAIRTFAEYASPSQRERYLPALLSSDALMGLCMTEPEAGSAITELSTSAVRREDGYSVTGTKIFSTHSADATVFLVYVRFGPGTDGIGSVLIDRDAPGLSIGPPSSFMNGEQWCELRFDDCPVRSEDVLLGEGGLKKQLSGFNVERIGNAARSLALGTYAFDRAKAHAGTRVQFGKTINEFQGIQWMFADAAVSLESARLLLLKAAYEEDNGLPSSYNTAVAKLACNRAGHEAADMAMQVMGASGFSQDELVEYCFRRTRGWMIAGGSLEVLKNRIAESIFDRRFSQRAPAG